MIQQCSHIKSGLCEARDLQSTGIKSVDLVETARMGVGWCLGLEDAVGLQLSQHGAYFANDRFNTQAHQPRVNHIHIDPPSSKTFFRADFSFFSSAYVLCIYWRRPLRPLLGGNTYQGLGNHRCKRNELRRGGVNVALSYLEFALIDIANAVDHSPSTTCKRSSINIVALSETECEVSSTDQSSNMNTVPSVTCRSSVYEWWQP